MVKNFLANEADRTFKGIRKFIIICWAVCIAGLSTLFIIAQTEASAMDVLPRFLIGFPVALAAITALLVFRIIKDRRGATEYGNLIVHSDEVPRDVVGRTIDEEADNGMILVDEFINIKPRGPKVMLLRSYLLICDQKVTAIPVDKIFWICAQVGYKGGPFIVRIKIFAERKIYDVDCTFVDHTKDIVDKIYLHIPNIFSEYDVFDLSYRLEEAFNNNYNQFLDFYRQHKLVFNIS